LRFGERRPVDAARLRRQSGQALLGRLLDGFRDRLARSGGELAHEAVGLRVLDENGHGPLLIS
jgi:hypothetical protein